VLHRHVDSFDYDVDQLLLGTLLFALLAFSVPTFIAYTMLFTLVNAANYLHIHICSIIVTKAT
jgi:phosphatidylinositol N-acetylglucosaminyltransferase subunit Q